MLAAMIAEVFYLQKPRNRDCAVGRVPVWLLYIFFGWTGAHRFVLKRKRKMAGFEQYLTVNLGFILAEC